MLPAWNHYRIDSSMPTCSRSSGKTVDAALKDDNIDEDVRIFINLSPILWVNSRNAPGSQHRK